MSKMLSRDVAYSRRAFECGGLTSATLAQLLDHAPDALVATDLLGYCQNTGFQT
ncbi:MAG TPA: hypothetical protein VMV10_05320 [Pirellulales bacterium]|nr:hypothetical protein [Pirellulales bacterium]